MSQFWLKFGKTLKSRPLRIHSKSMVYQILHSIRAHSYTNKRLILLPMLAAHPWGLLYSKLWVFEIWGYFVKKLIFVNTALSKIESRKQQQLFAHMWHIYRPIIVVIMYRHIYKHRFSEIQLGHWWFLFHFAFFTVNSTMIQLSSLQVQGESKKLQ